MGDTTKSGSGFRKKKRKIFVRNSGPNAAGARIQKCLLGGREIPLPGEGRISSGAEGTRPSKVKFGRPSAIG